MSFLAPLFLLAGAAIAAPIIFHLIRREPKGRVEFSSLMFIKPSPPRVTRRSRIDNWLLLLLRALAILLIAAAFTRPFLRTLGETTTLRPSTFTVFLVDKSASMQRDGLWQQAISSLEQQVQQIETNDRYAIATYDDSLSLVRGMKPKAEEELSTAIADLNSQSPSWLEGNLGLALVGAVELVDETMRSADESEAERMVVIISDMQASSNLDSLRGISWPKSTNVRLVQLSPNSPTNVSLVVSPNVQSASAIGREVADADSANRDGAEGGSRFYRVKLTNSADSTVGRYRLKWIDNDGNEITPSKQETNYVNIPPGIDRVVNIEAPEGQAVALSVDGDDYEYDNQFYVVVPEALKQTILMVGDAVTDPRQSLFYYLDKLPLGTPGRDVSKELVAPSEYSAKVSSDRLEPDKIPLVVLNKFPPSDQIERLIKYLQAGGRILVVIDQAASSNDTTQLAVRQLSGDSSVMIDNFSVKDYALLNRIDFRSDVFSALADARFSDFTKVQFWKHAQLDFGTTDDESGNSLNANWQVLASFDTGSPAVMKLARGTGCLYLLAAGWQPNESQLALSTKFVPMMSGVLGAAERASSAENVVIGQAPTLPRSESAKLTLPNGTVVPYTTAADAELIDRPGIYHWRDEDKTVRFAANMADSESDFGTLDRAALEQLGILFEDKKKDAVLEDNQRQKRDEELEQQQSIWKWLLVSAMGLVGIETFLSARRRRSTSE